MSKYGYPSHLIPNSEKNRDWILAYVKAAHKEFNGMNGKIFYGARYTYATIRDYAMGTQSISKYKRMLDVSESENDSWLNIDWSILPVVSRFRRLALAKLSKRSYNITATPIDILSQEEIQGYKAKQEVKIKMRSELQKMNSPLANEGVFSMEEGEPRDMEELQIHMDFSFKHKLSEEIEEVIKNVLNINDYEEIRNRLLEDAFDFGVCGVKEYVQDGVVRLRHVRPENIITSYCMNRDFSDAQHIGELKMMSLADIRRQAGAEFSEEQFYDIANASRKQLHLAYINKCLDQFKYNKNVIQSIGAEYTGPLHFVNFWMDAIDAWTKKNLSNPLVLLGTTKDVQDSVLKNVQRAANVDIIDIRYWHYQQDGKAYAPLGGQHLAPRQHARLLKPVRSSFDQVYRAVNEYRTAFDKSVIYSGDSYPQFGWAVLIAGGSLPVLPKDTDTDFLKAVVNTIPVKERRMLVGIKDIILLC